MSFPKTRMRRLRGSENLRRLTSEVRLSSDDFIYPIFVKEGISKKEPINSIPGQFRYSLNDLNEAVEKCEQARVPGIMVFGIPEKKDPLATTAYDDNGAVQNAVKQIKETSDLAVFTDVCLCHYTKNGHCGVVKEGKIDNDSTLDLLTKTALSHAKAGADFVAPSAMMDGQVRAIRSALDESFQDVGIMSYSAKFSSGYYKQYRDAVGSAPSGGVKDRSTHQIDFHSYKQALAEIELDLEEGTDIAMIKPALNYLDIITRASQRFDCPLAAFQVSGEYAMLSQYNLLYEGLVAIKRAGADIIISYGAPEIFNSK